MAIILGIEETSGALTLIAMGCLVFNDVGGRVTFYDFSSGSKNFGKRGPRNMRFKPLFYTILFKPLRSASIFGDYFTGQGDMAPCHPLDRILDFIHDLAITPF